MFLEAMLDAIWELGPMTDTGWNSYWVADINSTADTSSSGLKTDLSVSL